MMNAMGLQVSTPSDREIVLTRSFNAPRSLVFDTMARPELIQRWLSGPPGWTMVECESDPRVGGAFRHVWRGEEGAEMTMHGVYREIVRPERVVRNEIFELGGAGVLGEQLATLVLTEQDGNTMLTVTVLYPSKEARDATIASGMERGVKASYDLLEVLLATLA